MKGRVQLGYKSHILRNNKISITSSFDLSGSDSVDRWNLSLNRVSENIDTDSCSYSRYNIHAMLFIKCQATTTIGE